MSDALMQFGVTIVPKRFYASVLRRYGATLDLAHLSTRGHERMADQVARLLGLHGRQPERVRH